MKAKSAQNDTSSVHVGTLGTFAGVFTPSILTILGIILFMRLGYVVGQAGLGRALIILVLANGISVLTSVSLSAIATNLKVKGGGVYYLISRTLGLEFGGAIGIVLYLATSVSIAFYCIGFAEILAGILGATSKIVPQLIAALAVCILFILAWFGADVATKFQYIVMAILGLALVSFFWGGVSHWDPALLAQNWASPSSGMAFWVLFAIFFPAVTGFMQGVSMSGDLKDPGRSLPLGTFAAVGLSIVIYFLAVIVFAASTPGEVMRSDYGAMQRIAAVDFLITAGVIAATLSSAMASYLGAPRILQSLAGDRIFPFLLPFAKGHGPSGNPRRGILLSTAIAFATIALGNLNVIAPVVSMFFLISYGLLNYATYYEARAASPSFRPRFRWYNLRVSLVGAVACLGAMLAVDLAAGVIAVAILFSIYQYLKRTASPARWADSQRSYHLQRIREHLLAASKEPEHPRNWRPQLLLFSDDPHRRGQLFQFAAWCGGDSGFITVVRILEGQGAKMLKLKTESENELRKDIADHNLEAFPLVIVAQNLFQGIHTLVQAYGIGPLHANTILLNWFEKIPEIGGSFREILYGQRLRTAFRLGCNIVVLDAKQNEWDHLQSIPADQRRIDVWWRHDDSSQLMLLLAYIITRHESWDGAKIRVLAVPVDAVVDDMDKALRQILDDVRIEAEPVVLAELNADVITDYSKNADLVFLPFRLKGNQPVDLFGEPLNQIVSRLPLTVLVMAAEDIDLDAEPEEGKAAETADAVDALSDAEKRARDAEKDALKAAEAVSAAKDKLQKIKAEATNSDVDAAEIETLAATLVKAEKNAEKAARRSAKAKAKLETAAQVVEELGLNTEKNQKDSSDTTDS